MKIEKGISWTMGEDILKIWNVSVPVGAGICTTCRKRHNLECTTRRDKGAETEYCSMQKDTRDTSTWSLQSTSNKQLNPPMEEDSEDTGSECQEPAPMFAVPDVPVTTSTPSTSTVRRQSPQTGVISSEDTSSITSSQSSDSCDEASVSWAPTPFTKSKEAVIALNDVLRITRCGSPIKTQLTVDFDKSPATTNQAYEHESCQLSDEVQQLIRIYNEITHHSTKKQILSIFSSNFSKKELMDIIPGLTIHQIDSARKHALHFGPGKQVENAPVHRQKMDQIKLDHFLDFAVQFFAI